MFRTTTTDQSLTQATCTPTHFSAEQEGLGSQQDKCLQLFQHLKAVPNLYEFERKSNDVRGPWDRMRTWMTFGDPGNACSRPTIHANACHHGTNKRESRPANEAVDRREKYWRISFVGGWIVLYFDSKDTKIFFVSTHSLSVLEEGGGARLDNLATRVANHEARAPQLRVVGKDLHTIEKTAPRGGSRRGLSQNYEPFRNLWLHRMWDRVCCELTHCTHS